MEVTRPLSKAILKKMFLKVLNEYKPGGWASATSPDYHGILKSGLPEYFEIDKLDKDEYEEAFRAVFELERDGYIMQMPDQDSQRFKKLTKKGIKVIEDKLEDLKLTTVDIDQLLSESDLIEEVHDDFIVSKFDKAIFSAFKEIEIKVREKSGLDNAVVGADLMTKAFNPKNGILKSKSATIDAEHEAFHLLMRSAMMWFKNPSSHRYVGYSDEIQAAQVLGFAGLLLKMIDDCNYR